MPRRTVRKLNKEELYSETENRKRQLFDAVIREKLGDSMTPIPSPTIQESRDDVEFVEYEDDKEKPCVIPEIDDDIDDLGEISAYDKMIHTQLQLQHGEAMMGARVKGRKRNAFGQEIGAYNENPMMNTMIYEIEFQDGTIKEYAANVIAENIYAQVDHEGSMYTLLDAIIDFKKDNSAVTRDNQHVMNRNRQRRLRKTTVGWKLPVLWKDGNDQWIPLKDLKESHPVDVAEFAVAKGINREPAFRWWIPFTPKMRDAIIATVRSRAVKRIHKYGVEVPSDVDQAKIIDTKIGNDL